MEDVINESKYIKLPRATGKTPGSDLNG
jgi:hypothetical protein